MTPKEKAIQLYKKFDNNFNTIEQIKEACVICVDEIIYTLVDLSVDNTSQNQEGFSNEIPLIRYYKKVKEEILITLPIK